jgi:hypothetical protein
MSWQTFKQNILRRANSPDSIQDIDTVAKLYADEYDACMKRQGSGDVTNRVAISKGNTEIMQQLFKAALLKGQSSTTPYDLVGEMGKGVIAYWQGAQLNLTPIPLIPAPGSTSNIGVTSNVVVNTGVWAPAVSVPSLSNPYEQLDWSQVPLDKNSPEVQEIIAPNLEQIELELQTEPLVQYGDTDTYPIVLEMDNTVAEILDTALYEQKIIKKEPDTPAKKEEQTKLISSGYKTLDELLKIAGAWAPKLGKSSRVNYENLRSNYIAGVHGLCPQGAQAVVVALTGISGLGTISGNADWFSFKDPSTGGGRSSFAISIGGKVYYNDKVRIDFDTFVADSTQWQIGDVLVNGYESKAYGHIQVWTGFKWMSDFSQNKIHTTGCLKSSAALWRLNDNGIAAVESVKSKVG